MKYAIILLGLLMSWAPSPYAQTISLQRSEDEVHDGGNRGWGKTDIGLAWLVAEPYIAHPLYRALVVRKSANALSDWFERARQFYKPHGAKFVGNPSSGSAHINFPRGPIIRLGHLRDMAALETYMSQEYHKVLIEQAEQIAKFEYYQRLTMSCRSTIPELPRQIRSNSNPGGPGHAWIKSYFINVCKFKPICEEFKVSGYGTERRWRICIVGDIRRDMAHKPDYVRSYVAQLMSIKDPVLREAWLNGNYDIFTGQFFQELQTYDPREKGALPREWPRYRSLDWGYWPGYTAVGWYAVDFGGRVWKYRELYVQKTNPPDVAKLIMERSEGEEYVTTVADPKIWTKDQYGREINANGEMVGYKPGTSHSIAQELMAGGVIPLEQANNDRVSGWAAVKSLQYHDSEHQSNLMVSLECPETIRVWPNQQYNEGAGDPEDMDTDSEDHLPDETRYFAMRVDHRAGQPEPRKSEIQIELESRQGDVELKQLAELGLTSGGV